MEFYPVELRTNYIKSEYAVCETAEPVFSWGVVNSIDKAYQKSFRIIVSSGEECFWDSGEMESESQIVKYAGKKASARCLRSDPWNDRQR